MYLGLKYLHIVLVSVSIVLFQYRFFLKFFNKSFSTSLKVFPHLNDSLLLLTGISLAITAGINPFIHTWLLTKIIALLFYIGFGFVALKHSGHKSILSYIVATLVVGFMVLTALNKVPFAIGI